MTTTQLNQDVSKSNNHLTEDYYQKKKSQEISSNPYLFPKIALSIDVKLNGAKIMLTWKKDPLASAKQIVALPMREDDILLLTFPKCGTHWVSEILTMLINGNTNYAEKTKASNMLEVVTDLSTLSNVPSPRLLNTHCYCAHLPEEVVTKKVKIVHVIRNPRDTVVSMWHHARQMASPKLTFDLFLKGYTTEGYTAMSHQFNYLRQIAEFERAHPDHPIKHIHYEDLTQNPAPVIQDLAEFLNVPATTEFCKEIIEACSFEKLKTADESRKKQGDVSLKLSIYRKGVIGDWKNTFTVAQSEMFDEFVRRQTEKGLDFNFR